MSITVLPTEIVRYICNYLELRDWCAVRATCNAVYTKSLDTFAKRYSRSVGFIITHHGLSRLEELASNDAFRTHVEELWVTPSLFEGYYDMDLENFQFATWSHRERTRSIAKVQKQYAAYHDLVAEHLSIVESDTLSTILKRCVALFENLTVIRLQHCTDEFFGRQSRKEEFRCLGLASARRQLGFDPLQMNVRKPIHNVLKSRAKDHAVAFSALLEAVVSSGRKIKTLDTCNDEHCALPPTDVTLKHTRESLLSSLVQLEFLHLCISIWDAQSDDSTLKGLVEIPIAVATSLKVLKFSQWDLNGPLDPQYFDDISQRINFTQIKEIHLYWIEITFDSIRAFLRTAKSSLRTLSLESVNLKGTVSPMNIDVGHRRDLRNFPEMIEECSDAWRQVFNFLGDEYSLRSISLINLGYRGYQLHLQDNLKKQSGSSESNIRNTHAFDAERAGVSFKEWMTQLQPGPRQGPRGFIDTLPGKDYSSRRTSVP